MPTVYRDFNGIVRSFGGYATNTLPIPAPNTYVTGTSANDLITDAHGATLAGGAGDDTYQLTDTTTKIVEAAGAGIDKVYVWGNYALPDNVEVLDLKSDNVTGYANKAGSLLISDTQRTTLVSGAGKDVMVDNGLGSVAFSFSQGSTGQDVIYGFKVGTGAQRDVIVLKDYGFTSFDDVKSHIQAWGATDTLITFGPTDQILLRGVVASTLVADNFRLQLDTSKLHLAFGDDFNSVSLYDPATGTGTWKTTFNLDPINGPGSLPSRTQLTDNEVGVYVDPKATGLGTTPLGLNPFSVQNGVLNITASRIPAALQSTLYGYGFQSGILTTQKSFATTYGYFEMRAQLPTQNGMFPAFWMLPTTKTWPPELDVLEHVNSFGSVSQGYGSNDSSIDPRVSITDVPTNGTAFHTYGLMWTADRVSWWIDGVQTGSIPTPADMHSPMYMLVNLAVGGNWAGKPDANFVSDKLQIDYIRAYKVDDDGSSVDFSAAPSGVQAQLGLPDPQDTLGGGIKTLTWVRNLTGSAFNDTIEGSGSDDTLNGGDGVDTLSFAHATAGIRADLTVTDVQATGGSGKELISGFENIIGSDFNDVLRAGVGSHTILAGAGKDLVYADGGPSAYYDGGDGDDTLSFAYATGSVSANLKLTTAQSTGTGPKTILNFENLTGSPFADNLFGDANPNRLMGGLGADTITGGGGSDTFRYRGISDSTVTAPDLIRDFVTGLDKVDLTAVHTGTADKFSIYNSGTMTFLDVDLNGNGTVDMRIQFSGLSAVKSSDVNWIV